MSLIEKLKENYQNGKEARRLLRKKFSYYSVMEEFPSDTDIFYNRIEGILQKLDAIPKPKGFLEELAYTFGGI